MPLQHLCKQFIKTAQKHTNEILGTHNPRLSRDTVAGNPLNWSSLKAIWQFNDTLTLFYNLSLRVVCPPAQLHFNKRMPGAILDSLHGNMSIRYPGSHTTRPLANRVCVGHVRSTHSNAPKSSSARFYSVLAYRQALLEEWLRTSQWYK